MLQLDPGEQFAIVRQLPDPFDTGTYYVRAEIRNAKTDAFITYVTLTNRGSRRFSANWQVVADVSGLGTYVSIMTAVYTDAAFTTSADNYAQEIDTYLILRRTPGFVGGAGGGGGGGSGIDYTYLRKIIRDLFVEFIEGLKIPDYSNELKILSKMNAVLIALEEKEFPEYTPTDVSGIVKEVTALKTFITSKKDKELDLTPIIDHVTKNFESVAEMTNVFRALDVTANKLSDILLTLGPNVSSDIKEAVENLRESLEKSLYGNFNKLLAHPVEERPIVSPIQKYLIR